MNNEKPIDVPAEVTPAPGTQAVAVREPLAVEPAPAKPQVTAAQAKVEAIADLTHSAYARAATLQLSKEEVAALQLDFPDEAFKPGAAGKEHLIYIEHAYLRDRLNQVIGPGQWAIIPRNRWEEKFTTQKGTDASRVYVEAMLLVRGCFVAEAIGEMEYYPSNASQNYGDAVEGAKTAALRRCCKEFSIGLQAWKKDWCEGWWQRRRGQTRPAPASPPPKPPARSAQEVAEATGVVKPAKRPERTPEELQKAWVAACRKAGGGQDSYAQEFGVEIGVLIPNETLAEWPMDKVPTKRAVAEEMLAEIRRRAGVAEPPPEESPKPETPAPAKSGADPDLPPDDPNSADAPWRSYPCPWGKHAGVPLAELEKRYLYGLWCNYKVETEFNGKPKRPETVAKDQQFRDMLDAAGQHYEFTKKAEDVTP